jgi:hypothetical protein
MHRGPDYLSIYSSLGIVHLVRTQRRGGGGSVKSVCMRMGGGGSTQMYVRTDGEGVRAGYILNNVSTCVFFISELQK